MFILKIHKMGAGGGNLKPTTKNNFLNNSKIKNENVHYREGILKKTQRREFPGGLVVKTWHFHCRGSGSIPDQGTKIPQATGHNKKKNPKVKLPCDTSIRLLGIYPKKANTPIQKDAYTPTFTAALFTLAKIRKQPKCTSTDKRRKKVRCTQTTEHYIALKTNGIVPFEAT